MEIKNKKNFLLILLVFIFALSIRIYWIGQKHAFHLDELTSRYIAVGNFQNASALLNNENVVLYKGSYLKEFFFGKSKNTLSKDLYNLWKYNNSEFSHPNLYFMILRVGTEFTGNTPKTFMNLGCGLNIIFFIFSFIIMTKILLILFKDNKLVPTGLAVAFLNTGTISMTLFIRPYELQSLGILLISYVFLIVDKNLKLNENKLSKKALLYITPALSFAFLTGYFSVIYVSFLGIILLFRTRKRLQTFFTLIFGFVLALIVTLLFYNGYFNFINSQRFDEITINKYLALNNIIFTFLACAKNLFLYIYYGLCIIVFLIIYIFTDKNNEKFKGTELLAITFIWTITVSAISPFYVVRYILPVFPLLSILILNLLQKIKKPITQNIFILLIFFIYLLSAIFPYKADDNLSSFKYNNSIFLPFGGNLENLFQFKEPEFNPEYRVILFNEYWFNPMYLISTFKDNQFYGLKFVGNSGIILNNSKNSHFYFLTDSKKVFLNPNVYDVIEMPDYYVYKCYEVIKKKNKKNEK